MGINDVRVYLNLHNTCWYCTTWSRCWIQSGCKAHGILASCCVNGNGHSHSLSASCTSCPPWSQTIKVASDVPSPLNRAIMDSFASLKRFCATFSSCDDSDVFVGTGRNTYYILEYSETKTTLVQQITWSRVLGWRAGTDNRIGCSGDGTGGKLVVVVMSICDT